LLKYCNYLYLLNINESIFVHHCQDVQLKDMTYWDYDKRILIKWNIWVNERSHLDL